ncbi:hypothetical protein C8R48DRAFT_779257 [Suillus tomentosus]|nr:hypothetical protein C8R48DRAFT_779257 [Suillus tomentosus]
MLADFTVPGSCGKFPTDIGMPSGGSLTADQWLLLATVYGPIIIPQLWSACLPSDADEQTLQNRVTMISKLDTEREAQAKGKANDRKALEEARKQGKDAYTAEKARIALEKLTITEAKKQEKLRITAAKQAEKVRLAAEKKAKAAEIRAGKKRKALSQVVEDLPEGQIHLPPPPPAVSSMGMRTPQQDETTEQTGDNDDANMKFSLHPDDPLNFLKLSASLHLLMKHKISDYDISQADQLIRKYGTELITLYGSSVIKPNHHYATHVGDCARNFGPLHDFWTFLFEWLNKVLKSFKTNNHANGELETTFFQEFQRVSHIGRLTYSLLRHPKDSLPCEVAEIMLKATNEECGTVAGLAALSQELDNVSADGTVLYALSPRHKTREMSTETYRLLARTLCFCFPLTPVHCRSDRAVVSHSIPLDRVAVFFDYVIVNGKHYHASRTTGTSNSSFVHVVIPGKNLVHAYGEVLEIFQFTQDFYGAGQSLWFA